MTKARPRMSSMGTKPQNRLSRLRSRLSPMTNTRPSGTFAGPKLSRTWPAPRTAPRSSKWAWASSTGSPLIWTFLSRITTSSPGTATTRLMKSLQRSRG